MFHHFYPFFIVIEADSIQKINPRQQHYRSDIHDSAFTTYDFHAPKTSLPDKRYSSFSSDLLPAGFLLV